MSTDKFKDCEDQNLSNFVRLFNGILKGKKNIFLLFVFLKNTCFNALVSVLK